MKGSMKSIIRASRKEIKGIVQEVEKNNIIHKLIQ